MTEPNGIVPISIIWPEVEEEPVYRANQFLGQLGPGPNGAPEEFVLTLGYVAPPVLLGSPEEQSASFGALGAISVKTLARVSMSRGRLAELANVLQAALAQYENFPGGGE